MTVLDASALLAYLLDETGSDAAEEALASGAMIGAVNLAEVLSKLADVGQDPGDAMNQIGVLALDVVAFDDELAVETARLRPLTAKAGLSLGDRACLALGRLRRSPVVTADGAWKGVVLDVEIRLIR